MHQRQEGSWPGISSRYPACWAMLLLVGAVFGISFVMAILAAPGAARAATDDGADLPKLIVIIVVDGLPQEQVVKYRDQLGEGGFKRLLGRGAWFTERALRPFHDGDGGGTRHHCDRRPSLPSRRGGKRVV